MFRFLISITALFSWGAMAFDSTAVSVTSVNLGDGGRINGQIGALSNQANPNIGDVKGNRFNGTLEFDYFDKAKSAYEKESRFTFAAQHNDASLTQYSLQEAYVVLPASEKNQFKVGRQILSWSEVDSTWGFGKLNNRRNFDFFNPGQEGLVGLQFERKSANGMRYRAFYSALYVPEMNPGLDINKGDKTITTRSPWGNAPSTEADVQGTMMPIEYTVDYPEISEVIYRHSVGANIGFESKHWVMDNFIIRKPENQLSTKVNVNPDFIRDVVEAKVRPQFYYHDVYGSTLKWRNKDIQIYASGIANRPNTFPDGDREAFLYTEIKTEKRREDFVGAGISKTNDVYGIGFNYVARLSPFDRQKEELAEDPRWNQAVNVFSYLALTRKLTVSGDVKYDMLTTDRLIMAKAGYMVTRNFQMMVGMNSIGTPTNGKSYWSTFTNNDMVYGALRYIF